MQPLKSYNRMQMQPASSPAMPETPLAVLRLGGEKPHQGFLSRNPALYQGFNVCNSTTALGLQAAAVLNRIGSRCTGKERDAESGNDYFGARYYASSMGRWMSPDPTGLALAEAENPQSLNLYSYVQNRPLSMIDPDGLQTVPDATCGWLRCKVWPAIKKFFSGGGGNGGGDDGGGGGGWSPTPYPGKNIVNVYYPHGAGTIGGHISVGTYDSGDSDPNDPSSNPKNAYGFTTINQHWYVRTMLIVGFPFFKGWMEPDSESPRSKKGAEYRYYPIGDEGFVNANAAINNHSGYYRFWLLPRNCANAAEDVDHAAGVPWIPHHEIFWPHIFRLLSLAGWSKGDQ